MDSIAICNMPFSMGNSQKERHPSYFRNKILLQFRSKENIDFLRNFFIKNIKPSASKDSLLKNLEDAMLSFSRSDGRALDILASDPIVSRSEKLSLWRELRRLNHAFYEDHINISQSAKEPYHVSMFVADSLRPPGLEHLNGRHDGVSMNDDDEPWSAGNPHRSTEMAMAEYWGENNVASTTKVNSIGHAYGDTSRQRFMRYETIPVWQRNGRRAHDTDIQETLGSSALELDSQTRRWE